MIREGLMTAALAAFAAAPVRAQQAPAAGRMGPVELRRHLRALAADSWETREAATYAIYAGYDERLERVFRSRVNLQALGADLRDAEVRYRIDLIRDEGPAAHLRAGLSRGCLEGRRAPWPGSFFLEKGSNLYRALDGRWDLSGCTQDDHRRLLEALRRRHRAEPDPELERCMALVIASGGLGLEPLRPLLASQSPAVRLDAVQALGLDAEEGSSEAAGLLGQAVSDPVPEVAVAALQRLPLFLPAPAMASAAGGALRHPHPAVRRRAARSLLALGPDAAGQAEALAAMLPAETDRETFRNAASALARVRPDAATAEAFARLLGNPNADFRLDALYALLDLRDRGPAGRAAALGQRAALAALAGRDPEPRVRDWALYVLDIIDGRNPEKPKPEKPFTDAAPQRLR